MAARAPKSAESEAKRWQMTQDFKDSVRAELVRRGWSQAKLADEAGVSRPQVYRMFPVAPIDNEIWVSSAFAKVCRVLNMPPPMVPTAASDDEHERKLLRLARGLTPSQQQMLISFIESLLETDSDS